MQVTTLTSNIPTTK